MELNTLHHQAANGQRINKLSDDSASANRILDMQEEKGRITQYTKNSARAQNINNTTISQVQNFISTSDRINEIATLANDLKGEAGLKAYAEEVDELIEHALQSANARFNGEYIFGGIASGEPPFEMIKEDSAGATYSIDPSDRSVIKKDSSGTLVAAPTGGHIIPDDAKVIEVEYLGADKGASFHLSETGKVEPFTDGETNEQFRDFLNRMIQLKDALEDGQVSDNVGNADDAKNLGKIREGLESSEDDLIFTLSRQGSVQMRIDFDNSLNNSRFTDLETNISSEADVDIAQVMVKLTQSQNAYQASLQSAGRILNSSLLDYI